MVRVQTWFCMDGLANLVLSLLQTVVRSSILQVRGNATAMSRIECIMVYTNIVYCIHIFAFFVHAFCVIHRWCTTLSVPTYAAL
jgi:hypothetical protein